MTQNTASRGNPPLLMDSINPTILTYDSPPCPHLIRVARTCDFVYHGDALDRSLLPTLPLGNLTEDNIEAYLQSLSAENKTATTCSPALRNAVGASLTPSSDDLLADAVHDDCNYKSPSPNNVSKTVKLQDWVNDTLRGDHLDVELWAPLVRLLEYVDEIWLRNGKGRTDGKTYYALTIRAVKFEDVKDLDTETPCWHTEWWNPDNNGTAPTSPSDIGDPVSPFQFPLPSPFPPEEPTIYNTVNLDDPLFQRLPGTVSPKSPTFPDLPPAPRQPPTNRRHNLYIDVLCANTKISNQRGYSSSPPGQIRFAQPQETPTPRKAKSASADQPQFPSTPAAGSSDGGGHPSPAPSTPLSQFSRLRRIYSPASAGQLTPSPSSTDSNNDATSPPSSGPKDSVMRAMAPLAGPGTLFLRDGNGRRAPSMMDVFAAASGFPGGANGLGVGEQGKVLAAKEGEMVMWTKGGRRGYGPYYAAPTTAMTEKMQGEDRVFVSLVVGMEEQVKEMTGVGC